MIHGPLFALARVTVDPLFVRKPVWSPFRPLNQQTSRRKILGSTKIVEELWRNTTTGSSYLFATEFLVILRAIGIDVFLRRAGDVTPLIDRVDTAKIKGLTFPAGGMLILDDLGLQSY